MTDESFDATLEPRSALPIAPGQAGEVVAALEILFHSDLRRLGERHPLGPVSAPDERVIGRDSPLFVPLHGGPPRPLGDPCLSRRQAQVRWSPENALFTVLPESDAKRSVRLFDLTGRELGAPPLDVPPGTLLALGNRVLLLLTVRPVGPRHEDMQMVGASGAMAALRYRVAMLADLPDTVLVRGETGVGKELVAQALHAQGSRRGGPFLAVNCAALPEALMESELFGHVKGAYSGASGARDGLFMAAQGGTLFLDEIGEMPLATQAKLLRVLEVRRVRPVGAQNEMAVDARVVAATNRDLAREAQQGRFRTDLYSRLESPLVVVPSLRERREDIPLLFAAFLWQKTLEKARTAGLPWTSTSLAKLWREADQYPPPFSMEAVLGLLGHDWPRNVRELAKYASEVAAWSAQSGAPMMPPLGSPALPEAPAPRPSSPSLPEGDPAQALPRTRPDEVELLQLLKAHDYVQSRAARALGVPYTTLDRWMREVGIVRPRDLSAAAIEQVRLQARGDLGEMARLLRVSVRGLKLRLTELGLGE